MIPWHQFHGKYIKHIIYSHVPLPIAYYYYYRRNHLSRNNSIVVDEFQGLLRSVLVCPICNTESTTFDPFTSISLPLPINKGNYNCISIEYNK